MVPEQKPHYLGMIRLLLHFRWTWVGLIAPKNDNGERFVQTLTPVLTANGICVAFSKSITGMTTLYIQMYLDMSHVLWLMTHRKVTVLLYYGDSHSLFDFITLKKFLQTTVKQPIVGSVWIMAILKDITLAPLVSEIHRLHGSLSFSIQTKAGQNYNKLDTFFKPIKDFGTKAFHCSDGKHALSVKSQDRCREREKLEAPTQDVLESVLSEDGYSIFKTIQCMAHAIHAMRFSRSKQLAMGHGNQLEHQRLQPWQVSIFYP